MLMMGREMQESKVLHSAGQFWRSRTKRTTARTGLTSRYIDTFTLDQTFDYLLRYAFKASLIQLTSNTVLMSNVQDQTHSCTIYQRALSFVLIPSVACALRRIAGRSHRSWCDIYTTLQKNSNVYNLSSTKLLRGTFKQSHSVRRPLSNPHLSSTSFHPLGGRRRVP